MKKMQIQGMRGDFKPIAMVQPKHEIEVIVSLLSATNLFSVYTHAHAQKKTQKIVKKKTRTCD